MKTREEEAVDRYVRGEDTRRIGRDLGVAGETVRQWLVKKGIPRRSTADRNRRYTYWRNAFAHTTDVAAYWAGLLMADGNVSRKQRLVSLELGIVDIELLEGFRQYLQYSGPIAQRTRKSGSVMGSVRIVAPDLVEQLAGWGVVPRKTYLGRPGVKVQFCEAAFYRGLFDGDGCVHVKHGRVYASLAGNAIVVDAFRDWCWRTVREAGSLTRKAKYHVVQFGGGTAVRVLRAVYAPEGPRLSRKEDLLATLV